MFAALYAPRTADASILLDVAREFSPRIERQLGGRLALIDIAGLGRIVGDPATVAAELRAHVARGTSHVARGTSHVARAHVAPWHRGTSHVVVVAPSRIAALLLAVAGEDRVVLPGQTTAAVGRLPIEVLEALASEETGRRRPCALCVLSGARRLCGQPGGACTELPTLRRWGLNTLADLAALPADALAARLGQAGAALRRLARGLDTQPLVPLIEEATFTASLDLEWPIEDLQPLSFVLTRLLDPLGAALERADRAAAALVTELTLVTTRLDADGIRTRDTHTRRLELPAPMRDPRVLRTLILLDLESHPPPAGIDRVSIRLDPAPGRIVQFSLFEPAGPQPETIATLTSRLTALMGEGRVGSPVLVDSHAPDAFALVPFGSREEGRTPLEAGSRNAPAGSHSAAVLRRFRLPVAARVSLVDGRPAHVATDRIGIKGGAVAQWAGPWRSSGWWAPTWDRDEYDVALADGAAYRLCRDRHEDRWFLEGILD